ncbi:PHP domain-containing protein [Elusimicrobiota bacterium]
MRFKPDFHLHTNCSDGTLSPKELIEEIKKNNVTHFAVTDHDDIDANEVVNAESSLNGIVGINGVEINTNAPSDLLHILGYGNRLMRSERVISRLKDFRDARVGRAKAIIEKLNKLGLAITYEAALKHSTKTIGRANIADALVAGGMVGHRGEAFRKYLARGKPAYVEPSGPSALEAIGIIAEAGAVPVLAHPGVAGIDEKKLSFFIDAGLRGVEVFYPHHTQSQVKEYLSWADKYGLLVTCGSDYHGPKSGKEELAIFTIEEKAVNKFIEESLNAS